jgi:hypothetical protein
VADIDELGKGRFALPGGVGDAVLRDRIEDLQIEANRLSSELGRRPIYDVQSAPSGGRQWLGWAVLAVSVVAIFVLVVVLI